MHSYTLSHLEQLEAEAIFVLRETAAQFQNPGLLVFGGEGFDCDGVAGAEGVLAGEGAVCVGPC